MLPLIHFTMNIPLFLEKVKSVRVEGDRWVGGGYLIVGIHNDSVVNQEQGCNYHS